MKKTDIALLAGGWSRERDVSIKSGEAVFKALDRNKYNVTMYDPRDGLGYLVKERENIDLAFVLLHGKFGEDGCIQGMLDLLDIPFVGSGVLASSMASNKRVAKDLYKTAGLNVVEDVMLHKGKAFSVDRITEFLGNSTVVKPVSEGSSIGVSICHSREELIKGIDLAFQHDRDVMVEKYVEGREVTCCVMGGSVLETLPIVEIVPDKSYPFFDYEAKYTPGATREICPADLSETLAEMTRAVALKAHQTLKCRVWSRTDMILRDGEVYLLETNTIPGMTENSLVPLSAGAAGMSFAQLLDRLIELSLDQGSAG